MQHRTYKVFKASELKQIRATIADVVNTWTGNWFAKDGMIDFDVYTSDEIAEYLASSKSEDWLVGSYEDKTFALYLTPDLGIVLHRYFASADQSDNNIKKPQGMIARKLLNIGICTLIDDLFRAIYKTRGKIASATSNASVLLNEAKKPGSGHIFVCVNLDETNHMIVVMNLSGTGEHIVNDKDRKLLEPTLSAIGSQTVKVQFNLGDSIIDFQSLANMSIGDVLTIDTTKQANVQLLINNETFCTGKLGKKNGNYAVKIADCKN